MNKDSVPSSDFSMSDKSENGSNSLFVDTLVQKIIKK